MSVFPGLFSHLKIKVRRENSYQLVRTMNIVFLCKGLLYQLSDTSLRDYIFCFFFFDLSFKLTSWFFQGQICRIIMLVFSDLASLVFVLCCFSTFAFVTTPEGSILHPLLLSFYHLLQKAEIEVSSLHWEITTLPSPSTTKSGSELSSEDRGKVDE